MRSLFDIFEEDLDPDYEVQVRMPESNITLRPYQTEAVRAVYENWRLGDTATLVCLPTGTGKSVVFSEVMRRWVEENS